MKKIERGWFWTLSIKNNRPIYLLISDTVYPYISHINFIIGSTRNFYKL